MSQKVLTNNAGTITEVAVGLASSAGAGSSGLIPALDGSGRLDSTFMPVGIGAATTTITASEALAAGAVVNVWNNAGTANVRNADGSTSGKYVNGYVLAAVASGASATVYSSGINTQLTGLTAGAVYFLSASTAGGVSATAPSGSGQTVQRLGAAVSTTALALEKHTPYVLA